jgi:two-component system LytT family sensor kinase
MTLLLGLVQAMSFFLVIAYAYCKSPLYRSLEATPFRRRDHLLLFVFFASVSILGTYLGTPVQGAIANTRAIGSVLAGLIGGPVLGSAVGFTAGLHRYSLGGFSAFPCGVATALAGLLGGLVHRYFVRRRSARLWDPKIAFATTLVAEVTQMGLILLLARPYANALALVRAIAIPVILANSTGAALFMSILRDRRKVYDEAGAASGARALRIAERTLRLMSNGLDRDVAGDIANIIYEEMGVGAVAITDAEKVLAFVGAGAEHHHAGAPIASKWTSKAIASNEVTFVDGSYGCALSEKCPLNSVLVVPLRVDGEVLGTIELYQTATRFLAANRTLGEGLTSLLSMQLLLARYHEQKHLLVMAELKLARAQLNPHFLFNSLNTIMAMLPDGSRPYRLLSHLSSFFRENLKRGTDLSTIREELDHVSAYLEIEKARFEGRLTVEMDVDPSLLEAKVPTFTLQPIVENAIKHGISEMLTPGVARIHIYRRDGTARIDIEDNAGAYEEQRQSIGGLGIKIVAKRIEGLLGRDSRLNISCVPNELTRVSIRVPAPEAVQ